MSYYAPFYRAGYYNPMPQQLQPVQAPQMTVPNNDMIWVLNENEAVSYPVAPNNTVTLWDKNTPTIYVKSVDGNGIPSMRILDFSERTAQRQQPQEHVCKCGDKFVSRDVFEEKLASMNERLLALEQKPTSKKKIAQEANEDG